MAAAAQISIILFENIPILVNGSLWERMVKATPDVEGNAALQGLAGGQDRATRRQSKGLDELR